MTKQELNRDAKRLINAYKEHRHRFSDKAVKEFKRIYYADRSFEYLTLANVKGLLRINLDLRIIELHQFGIESGLCFFARAKLARAHFSAICGN